MIPVRDVSPWRRGDFRGVDALRAACEAVGFFVIEGHGVPAGLDAELERLTQTSVHTLTALRVSTSRRV
ncbi:MAG: 2-oxoglutarate and iron-dependent oxygenase domain-containing protein [Myxococcaceae bacterium]|nr:2-oxoglutarate and iron-dependent oxygenase domain-containing protein [Myxococcaceae bacterium]